MRKRERGYREGEMKKTGTRSNGKKSNKWNKWKEKDKERKKKNEGSRIYE